MKLTKGVAAAMVAATLCASVPVEAAEAPDAVKTFEDQIEVTGGDPLVSLRFETRFDARSAFYGRYQGEKPENEFGFNGSYLNFVLHGAITDQLNYHFRYRIMKDNGTPKEFMNSVDWIYLTYSPTPRWSFSAGKEIVMIGTFEYDAAPIDILFASYFWNHTNCYQAGVSGAYNFTPSQTLAFQVCNSLFSENGRDHRLAYNLMWTGHFAPWWKTLYSANVMEYARDRYINYVALGNRFLMGDVALNVDYINRYGGHHTPFFKDFTLVGKLEWDISQRWNVFAKGGYDYNRAQPSDTPTPFDLTVPPGTDRAFYGCGVQFYPLERDRNQLRLHAFWDSDTSHPRCQRFVVGVRWCMDVFSWKRK